MKRADTLENIAKEQGIADNNNAVQKLRNQIPSLATHVSFWWLWVEQLLLGFGARLSHRKIIDIWHNIEKLTMLLNK